MIEKTELTPAQVNAEAMDILGELSIMRAGLFTIQELHWIDNARKVMHGINGPLYGTLEEEKTFLESAKKLLGWVKERAA